MFLLEVCRASIAGVTCALFMNGINPERMTPRYRTRPSTQSQVPVGSFPFPIRHSFRKRNRTHAQGEAPNPRSKRGVFGVEQNLRKYLDRRDKERRKDIKKDLDQRDERIPKDVRNGLDQRDEIREPDEERVMACSPSRGSITAKTCHVGATRTN